MPNFTDEEFNARRRAAVRDNGYVVRIPGLEEIIHLPAEEPMTAAEEREWTRPGRGNIPRERREELENMQQIRRDRYQAMLRDPTPDILRSRSAIMASIDDAQDVMSTVGVLGRLTLPLLPRVLAGIVSGPIGWVMTGAVALNLMNRVATPGLPTREAKRRHNRLSRHNPFTQRGRAGLSQALADRRLHSGNLLEGAQVTDNIWGVGVCLGPVMSLPGTIGSGLVRMAMGERVDWQIPPTNWSHWRAVAGRAMHSMSALWGDTPFLSDDEIAGMIFAGHFAQQAFPVTGGLCEGVANVRDVHKLEVCAPTPTNFLTREVIQETGDNIDDFVEWPSTGEKWSNINRLTDKTFPRAMENIHSFYNRHSRDLLGYYSGAYAAESGLYATDNGGGSGTVETSYTIPSRAVTGLLDMNYVMPDDVTEAQINCLGQYLDDLERYNYEPAKSGITKMILHYAKKYCGFEFVQMT
jgi:hypothetical protein